MNKLIRIILGLATSLVLVNCGSDKVSIENAPLQRDPCLGWEGCREVDSLTYSGDTKKITYTNGGWYSPFPNFSNEISLEVNTEGLVVGSGKTVIDELYKDGLGEDSICELSGRVSTRKYATLVSSIKSEQTYVEDLCKTEIVNGEITRLCESMVDAGTEAVSLFEEDKANAAATYYLRKSDFSDVTNRTYFSNPERVRRLLVEIVEDLKAQSGCSSSSEVAIADYSTLRYTSDQGLEDPVIVKPGAVVEKRDWTVQVIGENAVLSGSIIVRTYDQAGRSYQQKTRSFKDFLINDIFLAGNKLSIDENQLNCLMFTPAWLDLGSVYLTDADGKLTRAGTGVNCNSSAHIVDESNLLGRINSFIDRSILMR